MTLNKHSTSHLYVIVHRSRDIQQLRCQLNSYMTVNYYRKALNWNMTEENNYWCSQPMEVKGRSSLVWETSTQGLRWPTLTPVSSPVSRGQNATEWMPPDNMLRGHFPLFPYPTLFPSFSYSHFPLFLCAVERRPIPGLMSPKLHSWR